MTGENMKGNDFDKLIAAWLDGRLTAEDSQVLQAELRESAAARAKFLKYSALDARLHEFADTSGMLDSEQHIVDVLNRTPSHAHESASVSVDSAEVGPEQSRVTLPTARAGGTRSSVNGSGGGGATAFPRLASWYTALAVGMLLVVSLFGYFNSGKQRAALPQQVASVDKSESVELAGVVSLRKPPAPVATLASAERALWEESQIQVGQALYEGESIKLREGKARISVGFGAEIVADAPLSITFLASDRIQLHQGKVAVDVAPWAKGFTVVTEEMDVVDLGTTFTVSATPGMNSETTVLKGVVRVHPSKLEKEHRRGLLISEGQRMSIDGKGSFENVPEENVQQLLNRLDFGVKGPYRPVDLNNTGLGLSVGDEDLHWRVVRGPEESFSGPQFAAVCVPHEAYLPNDPQKSQWISIADWRTAQANSTYTFQAVFDLEGYDLSTMQLFGRFLADNGIAAVRVNGEPAQVQSWVDNIELQPFGNPQFRFVNVTEGLVEGRNVIEVDVRNGMQRIWDENAHAAKLSPIPNPMALRVEWYAFGRQTVLAKSEDGAKLFRRVHEQVSPRLALSSRFLDN